ncbi:hypothetical protein [Tahibacter caeni]|uniref:hypothetical protein n=1 Tax=Tahibacter caeni TaxID=1453545 RepID=UPI0021489688|nr:hypothetical protein [Tahibacter caeni]
MNLRRTAFAIAASLLATTSLAGDLKLGGVALLQPEDVVGARVNSAADLAAYIQALERAAAGYFATLEPSAPRSGHLVMATKPTHATNAWVAFEPALPAEQAETLIRRLREVTPADTRNGPVVFALQVGVDGAAAPAEPAPRIEEWAKAVEKAGKALSVDEVVLRAWKP